MEQRKRAASFSFGHSGGHPVTFPTYTTCFVLPWCYSSMEPKDTHFSAPSREDKCCSTYGLQRREGEKLCAFPASPSPHLCAPNRWKVTLSSYMCGLKDYKTENGRSLFFLLLYTELPLAFLGAPSIDWRATGQRRRKGFLPANPRVQDVLFLLQQLMTP